METLRVVEAGRGMGNNCKDFQYDYDSACSTPYVSAPSSPGRGGFYFSAPTSPVRCSVSHLPVPCRLEQNLALEQSLARGISMEEEAEAEAASAVSPSGSSDFEFSARFTEFEGPAVTADELFCNGQIRPMKLATHLERPQLLRPLVDCEGKEAEKPTEQMRMAVVEEEGESSSGRERGLWRDKSSRHRRTRSLSPLRSAPQWEADAPEPYKLEDNDEDDKSKRNGAAASAGPSKRRGGSRRWMSLKDFLYRSKSEGRGHARERLWASFSSPAKQSSEKQKNSKKPETPVRKQPEKTKTVASGSKKTNSGTVPPVSNSNRHGQGQRRAPVSAHELHYTANRAQSEELRRKTYLPYRQGLLGCLGFSSKGYTTMNGFAKTLHPLS
uniref:DUF1645 domain-containing protein n=1 Tax=Araucaria cunninghamii TaxID=56994 RepID=A0A0D6R4V7_ARACU